MLRKPWWIRRGREHAPGMGGLLPVRPLPAVAAAAAIVLPGVLIGCSSGSDAPTETRVSRPASRYGEPSARVVQPGNGAIPKGGGVYKVGQPYTMGGRWYVPREEPGYDRTGLASWYGADFHGRRTANGEIYDMNALSAAHPTLPLPSYAYVTNLANGRTVLVRVNDRGPYVAGRLIDLSARAARLLGTTERGVADVRVRFAGYAPLDGNDRREHQHLAAQPWARGQMLASSGGPAFAAPVPARTLAERPPSYAEARQPSSSAADGWTFSNYRATQAQGRRSLGGPAVGEDDATRCSLFC